MKIKDLKMMINLSAVLLTLLVFSKSLSADEGDFNFGINLGQTIYASDQMDAFGSNAMGYGIYFGFEASDIFSVATNIMYSPYSNNSNDANLFYGTVDLQVKTYYDIVLPYIMAGLGFYRNSIETSSINSAKSSVGINFGAGLDVLIAEKFTVGFGANYHTLFNKSASGVTALADFFDVVLRIGYKFNTGTSSGW